MLTGYDAASNTFLVHDPCQASGPAKLSAAVLDRARQSFGTDEDLLWLDLSAAGCSPQAHVGHRSCLPPQGLAAEAFGEVC